MGGQSQQGVQLPGPLTNKPFFYKISWLALLAGATAIFIYHFYFMVEQYNRKDISTSIKQSTVPFEFPDIVICNNIITSVSTVSRQPANIAAFDANFVNPLMAKSIQREFMLFSDWLQIIVSTRKDDIMKELYGHDIKDMLLHCETDGHACDERDFKEYIHEAYLRCYQFAPRTKEDIYSIDLMLFSESLLANSPTANMQGTPFSAIRWDGRIRWDTAAGAALFVFPKGSSPPQRSSFQLSTGHETFVKVRQMDLDTLQTENRPCASNSTNVTYYDFDGETLLHYKPSINDCYQAAILREYEKECGCFSTTRLLAEFNNTGKGRCYDFEASSSKEEMQRKVACAKNISEKIAHIKIDSSCQNPCKRRTYSSSISSIKWPLDPAVLNTIDKFVTPKFMKNLSQKPQHYSYGLHDFMNRAAAVKAAFADLQQSKSPNYTEYQRFKADYNFTKLNNDLLRLFSSNFLRVKLSAADSRGSVIEENLAQTFVTLMSQFGGILGMYLGLSLLSLTDWLEFIYAFYKFIIFQLRRKKVHKRRKLAAVNKTEPVKNAW